MNKSGYFYYMVNIFNIFYHKSFKGWGRKRTGKFALKCFNYFGGKLTLYEDGFIRSLGLGVNGSPSFSSVEDNLGIYYDATQESTLEYILNTYKFTSDKRLMDTAYEAINLISKYNISKYNYALDINKDFFQNSSRKKVLIIAQTSNDASLKYGLSKQYSTKDIIEDAIYENPSASIYIKIHPDVITGKKESDICIDDIPNKCIIIDQDINPISLLKYMDKVYTKTSGMGMEALILGKEVTCYGLPYYAGWGLTHDKQEIKRRKRTLSMEELFAGAYILYSYYYNPYTGKRSTIIESIKTIVKYRDIDRVNEGKLYFFGFSWWKKDFIKSYFLQSSNTIIFCKTLNNALSKGLSRDSKIFIWGKKSFNEVEQYANKKAIPLSIIEDGFIRSVSLGSDLTKAYSLVVDRRGIYFDATKESDLEYLLNTYIFDTILIERARVLQEYLVQNKISKYNIDKDKKLKLKGIKKEQIIILVPGQVEDDASIIYGASGMTNLELLKQTRDNAPHAYIIYKPHPDVIAGNRKGDIAKEDALLYCNTIIQNISIDSVLEKADEVHTMTSLVGFEALLRGKKVYTYGLPFYAGWGLTTDKQSTSRREKKLTLYELIAVTLIVYPRYINPKTNKLCEIEMVLSEIDKEKRRYNNILIYRLYIDTRNFISRKIQQFIKVILGE